MNLAAMLCSLIAARLDGVEHAGLRIYPYGGRSGDIELVPAPMETLVLVVDGDRLRWLEVNVREDGPKWAAIAHDPEIRAELRRRAGLPAIES